MSDVRTGYLFKLSESEIAALDELVNHFNSESPEIWYWKKVNRSDVIRKLIRDKQTSLELAARTKLEAELAGKPIVKEKKPAKKKAVKP